MAYQGWLSLEGAELVNNSRTAAYARGFGIAGVGCVDCDDLAASLGDAPYTNPAADDAPWYDPAEPASARFAGLLALEFSGLSNGTGSRAAVDLLTDGATLQPLRYARREVVVRAVAVAADDQALSYGIAWLASALRGSKCTGLCGAGPMCLYAYCPCCADDAPDPCGDNALRTVYETGLLEGPTVTDRSLLRNAALAMVEFTLVSGLPWLYREPVPIATICDWVPVDEVDECVEWIENPSLGPCGNTVGRGPRLRVRGPGRATFDADSVCDTGEDCLTDPNSGCPPQPVPPRPPVPPDPCTQVCFDATTNDEALVVIPPGATPLWLDAVPLVKVTTGAQAMRGLTLTFYANPTGAACTDDLLHDCAACSVLSVPYIPPDTTFIVDGRIQSAYAECQAAGLGKALNANASLYGADGGLFTWPVLDCGGGLCLRANVQTGHSPDACVDVSLVPREDAA